MGADGFNDRRNLFGGKSESLQQFWHFLHGIREVVPRGERRRFFRPVADKHPEVVHPRRRIQHVIIEWLSFREPFGEVIEAGLMTEFVWWLGVRADVVGDGLPEI